MPNPLALAVRTTVLLAATGLAPAVAATFNGANLGAIPDGDPTGRDITFEVSGLKQGVRTVELSLGITHTWISDLTATLISPDGLARLVVFGRAGRSRITSSGHDTNLDGLYTFSDLATGDLWATIAGQGTVFNIPPGAYRTTTAGKPNLSDIGGCSTHLNRAFGGLTGAQMNGTWTLRLVDSSNADAGVAFSAGLIIQTGPVLFGGGFEDGEPGLIPPVSDTRGRCREIAFDFTGTGRTSYTVVRNTGGGSNGVITWYIRDNDSAAGGAQQEFEHGNAGDVFLDGDHDGDGIRDAVVWTSGSQGVFKIRRSSRPGDAPRYITHGRTGDNPKITGDYDGDNVTDAAAYRLGASAGMDSSVFIRLSRTGEVRDFKAGLNGHFPTGGLDMTGDGIADVATQSGAGGGNATFQVYDGSSGSPVAPSFLFGRDSDVIVPGNFVGSARADLTVLRGIEGLVNHFTRDGETGALTGPTPFGASATDFMLSGDFDGDGFYDYAGWRPSATPGQSKFLVRPSLNPGVTREVPHGHNGDYAVANGRNN